MYRYGCIWCIDAFALVSATTAFVQCTVTLVHTNGSVKSAPNFDKCKNIQNRIKSKSMLYNGLQKALCLPTPQSKSEFHPKQFVSASVTKPKIDMSTIFVMRNEHPSYDDYEVRG